MSFLREDDTDDAMKRCATCRRELHPWETVCPDDGGAAVAPEELSADHDALLARLLAEDTDGSDGADDGEATDDAPTWPSSDG